MTVACERNVSPAQRLSDGYHRSTVRYPSVPFQSGTRVARIPFDERPLTVAEGHVTVRGVALEHHPGEVMLGLLGLPSSPEQ